MTLKTSKETKTNTAKKIIERSYAIYQRMKSTFMPSLRVVAKKHNLRNGLYYIVLTDLSGSTDASGKMSRTQYPKWINGFIEITKKALDFTHRNDAAWGLKCGDASLFLFRNFEDILEWRENFISLSIEYNKKCDSGKIRFPQYYNKIIIHLGEVDFDIEDEDLKSFAINIVFKIEKKFEKNDFGITEAVRQAILPEIRSGRFEIKKGVRFSMDEKSIIIPLWKLIVN